VRLSSLSVINFRSIADTEEFSLQPILALIGENNCGKSNILRAVEVFLSAGSGKVSAEDFKDKTTQIKIKGTFEVLTDVEKRRWKPYLVEGRLILEKHIGLSLDVRTGKEKVTAEFHGYKAEPKEWFLSLDKIGEKYERPKWADIVKETGLPGYFLQDGKCTKADFTKALDRYLDENDVEYDTPDLSSAQALGLQSNVVSSLPAVYLLPAITDYADEIDRRSSTTTFRRLMGDLSGRILQKDPRFCELQTALDTIKCLLNKIDDGGAVARIGTLEIIEKRIAEILGKLMPSVRRIALSVDVQNSTELFSTGVSMAVDDGVETDVLAKGHGLQRCIVFTLLQTLILNERNLLIEDGSCGAAVEKPIILLIEEPELYIHPQLGKLFFDVMREFSKTDQVLYSTHSPLFVDAYEYDQVALVSKSSVSSGTKVKTCDVTAFDGLTERKIFKGLTRLNPAINELFFARCVLLVEGPEDVIAVTAALQKLGKIKLRVEEIDWTIISCGGKESIPFFQRVLNAFDIQYAVLHDTDIEAGMTEDRKKAAQKENDAIKALAGTHRVYGYPMKLEASLGRAEHFKDQYEAHYFFQDPEAVTAEVEGIIREVFS
jgi:putative ATP-dependent endonuclease of OLD family